MPSGKPKNGPRRTLKRTAQAAVDKKLGSAPELCELLRELILTNKEIYAQNRVLIAKLHNLQVEVKEVITAYDKLLLAFHDLLQEPAYQSDAEKIVHDFVVSRAASIRKSPK